MHHAGENWLVKAKFKNSVFSILADHKSAIGRPGLNHNMEIKNWHPNRGVNTFPKIICTACRTVLIQSALCSPDLGESFRYPQHVCNMRKNFRRGLWSSSVCSKGRVNEACSNYNLILAGLWPAIGRPGLFPPKKYCIPKNKFSLFLWWNIQEFKNPVCKSCNMCHQVFKKSWNA